MKRKFRCDGQEVAARCVSPTDLSRKLFILFDFFSVLVVAQLRNLLGIFPSFFVSRTVNPGHRSTFGRSYEK